MQWYCNRNGKRFGPTDEATVRRWIHERRVGPTDLAWTSGMSRWLPLAGIETFADEFGRGQEHVVEAPKPVSPGTRPPPPPWQATIEADRQTSASDTVRLDSAGRQQAAARPEEAVANLIRQEAAHSASAGLDAGDLEGTSTPMTEKNPDRRRMRRAAWGDRPPPKTGISPGLYRKVPGANASVFLGAVSLLGVVVLQLMLFGGVRAQREVSAMILAGFIVGAMGMVVGLTAHHRAREKPAEFYGGGTATVGFLLGLFTAVAWLLAWWLVLG